jgi:CHAT domain-containing protein/Tfp pilus assembly protein PilF
MFPRRSLPCARGIALLLAISAFPWSACSHVPRFRGIEGSTDEQKAELLAERENLLKQARALDREGKTVEAIAAEEEVIRLERRIFGDVPQELVPTLNWVAERQEERDDFEAAQRLRAEALDILSQLLPPDDWRITDARLALAHVKHLATLPAELRSQLRVASAKNGDATRLYGEGKYVDAIQAAQESLEIRKTVLGPSNRAYATSLNNLAVLYQTVGDYRRAETLFQEVLKSFGTILGKSHPDYATSLNRLGLVYRSLENSEQAFSLCREALEIRKSSLGESHPDYAASLHALAQLYEWIGDEVNAERLHCEACQVLKTALGETHPDFATSLCTLARLYDSMNDYVKSEPLYRQALKIQETELGEEHPGYAASLNGLASLYQSLGDYPQAESLFRQALDIRREAIGVTHPDYFASVHNLAIFFHTIGDYAQAEPLYRDVLEFKRKTWGEIHSGYADVLGNLGSLYFSNRDNCQAEWLLREALEIKKETVGQTHASYAATLDYLATVVDSNGDYAQAESLYRQALDIRKSALHEAHPDYAASLNNLAMVYRALGEAEKAESLCRQALQIMFAYLDLAATIQSERQQLATIRQVRYQLDNYLSIVADRGASFDVAYEQVLGWKGSVLARQQFVWAARDNEKVRATFSELEHVTARLARLAFATPKPDEHGNWRQRIGELSSRKEMLEARIAEQSRAFRQAPTAVTLKDLRAALPTDVVLVDILEVSADDVPQGPANEPIASQQRFLAFLVRKEGPVELVVLENSARIAELIETWRGKRTSSGDQQYDCGQSVEARQAASELRQRLWVPLEARLGDARTVLISVDGMLGKLPFAALPGREPNTYLIEEGRLIAVIPSPAALPVLTQKADHAKEKNLLVLGGVDYDRAAAAEPLLAESEWLVRGHRVPRGQGETRWQFLQDSEGELLFIERRGRKQFQDKGILTLDGGEATEQAFRQEAPRFRNLHLATHGFFASSQYRSALDRSLVPQGRTRQEKLLRDQSISGYHPNLLSGIVLAGANHPPEEGDDGILTAEEVQTLDLRGTELVVLSACETGLGKTAGGEGLLGLQRSFQVAGARTVIASLWKVNDMATRNLMERFYDNLWNKKMSKLDALGEAQLWMLRERGTRGLAPLESHSEQGSMTRLPPYYWAAFVLSGDWR